MKVFAIAAFVAAVAAAPNWKPTSSAVPTPTSSASSSAGTCNNNQKAVCAQPSGLLGLVVDLLGGDCSGTAYCCTTTGGSGALIDLTIGCIEL